MSPWHLAIISTFFLSSFLGGAAILSWCCVIAVAVTVGGGVAGCSGEDIEDEASSGRHRRDSGAVADEKMA